MIWELTPRFTTVASPQLEERSRQDLGAHERPSDGTVVEAISAGVGNAKVARIGAKRTIAAALNGLKGKECGPSPVLEEQVRAFSRGLYHDVLPGLTCVAEDGAYGLSRHARRLFASVLLTAWIVATGTGHGSMAHQPAGTKRCEFLFERTDDAHANEQEMGTRKTR